MNFRMIQVMIQSRELRRIRTCRADNVNKCTSIRPWRNEEQKVDK